MRRSSIIVLALLLAACGSQTGPAANRAASTLAAQGAHQGEDDLAPVDRAKVAATIQRLAREGAVTRDGSQVFGTHESRPARATVAGRGGVTLTGALTYPGLDGKSLPAANVTVHFLTPGGLMGGGKEVGTALTDAKGNWRVDLAADLAGKKLESNYELGNRYWTINKYRWAGPTVESATQGQTDTGARAIDPASANGKAALIHLIWNRALGEFQKDGISLDWWKSRIGTNWPVQGNYYSFGTVNLSDAEWWDVNGHEIGHSMFFAAFNTNGGGGQHYIDRCYEGGLAWSEGFASFFSGVISVARNDEDAKFEFMVPRRKPIRLENVPTDVCEGYTNEWRVSCALWDLYDNHVDGTDKVSIDFKPIWDSLANPQGARMKDVRDAFNRIAGGQSAVLRPAMEEAFKQSGVPVTPAFAVK